MPTRKAIAEWRGNLPDGAGEVSAESGALDSTYSVGSRFESASGTNPEELLGAAHAACFSMFLAGSLSKEGHVPESVRTEAAVQIERGVGITRIDLRCEVKALGIEDKAFQALAQAASRDCPVSKALSATPIHLEARLS